MFKQITVTKNVLINSGGRRKSQQNHRCYTINFPSLLQYIGSSPESEKCYILYDEVEISDRITVFLGA